MRRYVKKSAISAAIVALVAALSVPLLTTSASAAPGDWNPEGYTTGNQLPTGDLACEVGTIYQVQSPYNGALANFYRGIFADGSTTGGTPTITYDSGQQVSGLNAIGVNPSNGLLYAAVVNGSGVDSAGNDMVQSDIVYIDRATGQFYGLGKPNAGASAGSTSTAPFGTGMNGFNSGAWDESNNYYLGRGGNSTLYVVNFDAGPFASPTWKTVRLHYADGTNAAGVPDYTFAGGYLWGRQDNNGNLIRINPADGLVTAYAPNAGANVTPVTFVGALPTYGDVANNGRASGGAFTFGNGNIGLVYNSGTTSQISIDNFDNPSKITILQHYKSPYGEGTDGTSCSSAATDLSIEKTGDVSINSSNGITSLTWTLTVKNEGPEPSSGSLITDTVPAGFTNIAAANGTVGTPAADGTTPVTFAVGQLDVGETATYTLSAEVGSSIAGKCITNTANVFGNEEDPNPGNDDASATNCLPGLSLKKTADPASGSRVNPGDVITYSVEVRNTGSTNLTPAVVTDDLSNVLDDADYVVGSATATAGAAPTVSGTTLTWSGDLAQNQTVTLTYQVKVKAVVPATAKLVNVVIGNGSSNCDANGANCDVVPSNCPDPAAAAANADCTTNHTPNVPGLVVKKSADPVSGSRVEPGQTITYSVTAQNTGNVDLSPATITDDLSDVLDDATLTVGSLTSTVGAAPTVSGSTLSWSGTLAAGATVTLTYQVVVNANVPATAQLVNVVVGEGSFNCDDTGANCTEVPSNCVAGSTDPDCTTTHTPNVPGLELKKTANPASGSRVEPGDTITYTVTAENTGNVDLTNAVVTDDLTDVLDDATYVADSATASAGTAPTIAGTTLTWTGSLAAGATVTLTYQVTVNADVTADSVLVNVVVGEGSFNCDDTGANCTEVPSNCVEGSTDPDCTTTHTPNVPGLELKKSADPASGSRVNPGDTITYTVTAENTGNVALTDTVVTDDLTDVLDDATYVADSATASAGVAPTVTGTTLTWTGDLAVGATVTLTYQVTVNADVTADSVLVNVVTGEGSWNCDDTGENCEEVPSNCVEGSTDPDCTTTHTPNVPGLELKKSADPASGSRVEPGETITYSVTVQNTGNVPLTNTVVTDDLADVLDDATYVDGSATASAGAAPTVTGSTLSWTGDLAVGETVTLTYAVTVNADVTAESVLVNLVVGNGTWNCDDTGENCEEVPSNCVEGSTDPDCTTTHTPNVPGLELKKSADPASGSRVNPGDTITYTVTAENTGNVVLTDALVTDDLTDVLDDATYVDESATASSGAAPVVNATTLTWTGDIAPGETVTLTYQVTVNADVTAESVLVNVVVGEGSWNCDDTGENCEEVPSNCVEGSTDPDCTTTHTPNVPGLELKKSADPASGSRVNPGDTVTYTVTAENTGNVAFTPATVTDDLTDVLDDATLVDGSATASMGDAPTISGTTLTWSGDLAPGETVTITYAVTVNADVTAESVLVNVVAGDGSWNCDDTGANCEEVPSNCVEGSTDPDCTTTHTPNVPGLELKKSADPASGSRVNPGDTITYTVTAQNTGNVPLTNTVVTDDLTDVLDDATLVDGSASASSGAAPTISGTTLTWTGDIAAGETVTLTYTVTVNADVTAESVLVNVVVGSGSWNCDDAGENCEEVPSNCAAGSTDPDCTTTHTPNVPGLVVAKSADPASGSRVNPGDTITYTVTAQNTGNVAITPAVITDDLADVLDNATLVEGSVTASAGEAPVVSGTTLTWAGDLDAGATVTLTYAVTVNADVNASSNLVNVVVGEGSWNCDDSGENCQEVPSTCPAGSTNPDCTTTHTPNAPGFVVKKSSNPASGSQVKPGDAITYTVTAENTGNVDLTPILLTDDLSKVLDDATIIEGTLTASFGDAPTISGTTLTWSGDLAVGESVTLTYAVKVKADVTADAKLVNVVVGSGSANCDEQGNCTEVPSNCPAGSTSADCTTTHTADVPAPPKPGLPATGTGEMWSAGIAAMIVLAVGAGLLTIRRRQTS